MSDTCNISTICGRTLVVRLDFVRTIKSFCTAVTNQSCLSIAGLAAMLLFAGGCQPEYGYVAGVTYHYRGLDGRSTSGGETLLDLTLYPQSVPTDITVAVRFSDEGKKFAIRDINEDILQEQGFTKRDRNETERTYSKDNIVFELHTGTLVCVRLIGNQVEDSGAFVVTKDGTEHLLKADANTAAVEAVFGRAFKRD